MATFFETAKAISSSVLLRARHSHRTQRVALAQSLHRAAGLVEVHVGRVMAPPVRRQRRRGTVGFEAQIIGALPALDALWVVWYGAWYDGAVMVVLAKLMIRPTNRQGQRAGRRGGSFLTRVGCDVDPATERPSSHVASLLLASRSHPRLGTVH
jgi:hypothetical protein